MQALINELGAQTYNAINWSAEGLNNVFFSTYPHQPMPVSLAALVFSLTVSNMFIVGDLYDLVTAVMGYDIITGQHLAGFERLVTLIGVIPIPGISGGNLRHGMDAVDSFASHGDELASVVGSVGDACRINSFSAETPVVTDEGAIPIKDVDVGDRVLAWDELTETTDYYLVTAAFSHVDATIVELTIDGDPSTSSGTETIETTADHPFYVVAGAPWLNKDEVDGRWVDAGELAAGDAVQNADGTTGVVDAVTVVAESQRMYNLTVADAHTFFVGEGAWLVHNSTICRLNANIILFSQAKYSTPGRIAVTNRRYQVADNVQWLVDNPSQDLPWGGAIGVFVKQPFMDKWGPLIHEKGYVGDPINLATGFIYTLDNRRLITYKLAKRETVPIYWADFEEIYDRRYEFDTPNFGLWIEPRVR